MNLQFLLVGAGCLLVLAALFGGGFEIQKIRVPELSGLLRFVAGMVGAAFVWLGIGYVRPDINIVGPPSSAPQQWRTWNFAADAHPSFNCDRYIRQTKEDSNPWSDIICMNNALADADRKMGDHYRAFIRDLPSPEVPNAKEDQRKWIDERNRDCPVNEWDQLETPSIVKPIADCLRKETQERTNYFIEHMQSQ